MKKCPVCQRTYADETLNFCLEDGTTLVAANAPSGFQNFSPPAAQQPLPEMFSPRKKPRKLLWILGIFGALAVLSVVGTLGLLLGIGIAVGNDNKNDNRIANRANFNRAPLNRSVNNNVANSTVNAAKSGELKYDDPDFKSWGVIDSQFGHGETKNGEFHVSSKKSDNYYVIIANKTLDPKFVTNNATTKVTVRSVAGESPNLGYGLVVHSSPVPLVRGYAFLIRTDNSPSYRIVKHENNNETELIKWTPAPQIRTGSTAAAAANELEVRSDGKNLHFFINGQYANMVSDTLPGRGIVGIYTSGTPTVAFSNLKITEN